MFLYGKFFRVVYMLFPKLNATLNSFVSSSLPVDVCGAQLQRVKKVVAELNICHGPVSYTHLTLPTKA